MLQTGLRQLVCSSSGEDCALLRGFQLKMSYDIPAMMLCGMVQSQSERGSCRTPPTYSACVVLIGHKNRRSVDSVFEKGKSAKYAA